MNRLIAYYGDDFTGSTDVMEALSSHGVKSVLFTRVPSASESEPFLKYPAVGLAGISRSQSPQWMNDFLPENFSWLKSLDSRFVHYKVCSTFDSSPTIGNIGRAIEIGQKIFDETETTLILGAPQLKRYTFSDHLFAAYNGQNYRIDRHPVMRHHPVTPMTESDVYLHLAQQGQGKVSHVNVWDDSSQLAAGQKLLDSKSKFIVGSSGVEYALVKALQLRKTELEFASLAQVDRLLVISGSVSPTTARQIEYSQQHGFIGVPADPLKLVLESQEASLVVEQAIQILARGGSPLVYTARGPASDLGAKLDGLQQALSQKLGWIAQQLTQRQNLKRLVFAGGDTSSHALSSLDIYALTTRMPLRETPGSPVCETHSSNPIFDKLEMALKGGQVGGDDYFVKLRDGIVAT